MNKYKIADEVLEEFIKETWATDEATVLRYAIWITKKITK